jgi:hypothetical protein
MPNDDKNRKDRGQGQGGFDKNQGMNSQGGKDNRQGGKRDNQQGGASDIYSNDDTSLNE